MRDTVLRICSCMTEPWIFSTKNDVTAGRDSIRVLPVLQYDGHAVGLRGFRWVTVDDDDAAKQQDGTGGPEPCGFSAGIDFTV